MNSRKKGKTNSQW